MRTPCIGVVLISEVLYMFRFERLLDYTGTPTVVYYTDWLGVAMWNVHSSNLVYALLCTCAFTDIFGDEGGGNPKNVSPLVEHL